MWLLGMGVSDVEARGFIREKLPSKNVSGVLRDAAQLGPSELQLPEFSAADGHRCVACADGRGLSILVSRLRSGSRIFSGCTNAGRRSRLLPGAISAVADAAVWVLCCSTTAEFQGR